MIIASGNLLEDLKKCGGYYTCLKDSKRLGPLVGYTGKYRALSGAMKAYVGDVYYNFAKMEQYPDVYDYYTFVLAALVKKASNAFSGHDKRIDIVLGAPMGGIILSSDISRFLKCRRMFTERKIISVATSEKREESIFAIDRYDIKIGDNVILIEDICNNFSTIEKLANLTEENGGKVIAVVCMLNRSNKIDFLYKKRFIPVISLLHIPTIQYKQEDFTVIGDIFLGNVVWKPKNEWKILKNAMAQAEIEEAKYRHLDRHNAHMD